MKNAFLLLLFLSFFIPPGFSEESGQLIEGIKAYHAGDFEAAKRVFEKSAEEEDPMGLHLLASLYYEGKGVEKDLKKAVDLFEEAAAKGFVASNANLGLIYQNGEGVEKNLPKAIEFYKTAAEKGHLQSLFNLGQIYRKGEGVTKNLEKAADYYSEAAVNGYLPAFNEFGLLFAQGQGVKRNYVEAYAWLALGAENKDEQAAKNLETVIKILGKDMLPKANDRLGEIKDEYFNQLKKPK